MKLVFGWELDGQCYPETPFGNVFGVDEQIVGPDSLIMCLQTRLGLRRRQDRQPVRVAKYFAAIERCDDGRQFYSNAFSKDPWSTAEHLLAIRDELKAGGWDGANISPANKLIVALSALEAATEDIYSRTVDGIPELIAHLNLMRFAVIEELHLAESKAILPPIWQILIDAIAATGTRVIRKEIESCPQFENDLAKLRNSLHAVEAGRENLERQSLRLVEDSLDGDGSICLLRASNEYEAADVVASWLAAGTQEEHASTVVIRGGGVSLLDNACTRQGLPRIGGDYTASSRWLAQLLPLAFEICWLPLDVQKLIDFLNLPDLPVPRLVAFALSQALRHQPGLHNEHWLAALDKSLSAYIESKQVGASTANDVRLRTQLERTISFWVSPSRFDEHDGIPADFVLRRLSALREWCIRRMHATNEEMYGAVVIQCDDLRQTVIAIARPTISRSLFDRLVQAVLDEGIRKPAGGAEASLWTPVYSPGQVWAPADIVLWWSFIAPPTTDLRLWTANDLNELRDAGVLVEDLNSRLRRSAALWRKAVLCARNKLILVFPETLEGARGSIHPFWEELVAIGSCLSPNFERIVTETAQSSSRELHPVIAGRRLTRCSTPLNLPETPSRTSLVAEGAVEIPTSLPVTAIELLIACPFAFVMRNVFELRTTSLLDVPDGEKLLGTFAHGILASIIQSNPSSPAAAKQAAFKLFDDEIGLRAAPLLAVYRSTERLRVRELIGEAAANLIAFIKENRFSIIAAEAGRKKGIGRIEVDGRIDLILQDADQRRLVIDHKWTKSPMYRFRELEENRAIQLAAYAWFESESSNGFPHVAFNMMRQNELYSSGDHDQHDVEGFWHDVELAIDELTTEITAGHIVAAGIADEIESEQSRLNGVEPPCNFCNYSVLCGRAQIAEQE